jgi:hypothetical protein
MLETRPIETETELCQRYFARFSLLGPSVPWVCAAGAGVSTSTTNAFVYLPYPQAMRATPTLSQSAAGTVCLYDATAKTSITLSTIYYGTNSLGANITASSQTIGRGTLYGIYALTGWCQLDAEI